MRYMLLLYSDETGWQDLSPADRAGWMAGYADFGGRLAAAGVLADAGHFETVGRTRLVSHEGGKPGIDGRPFHTGAAQLAGYFLLDVASEEEAVEWAVACPGSHHGWVEVRPLGEPPSG